MNYLWGSLLLVIGLFMFIGAMLRSEFILYKILHARAKILWKDNAHTFLMVSGMIIVFLSSLFFLNIWG